MHKQTASILFWFVIDKAIWIWELRAWVHAKINEKTKVLNTFDPEIDEARTRTYTVFGTELYLKGDQSVT